MDSEFRKLSDHELGLPRKLLEPNFPGRDELVAQLPFVEGKQIIDDGTLSLRCSGGPPCPSRLALVTEAQYTDEDGIPICVMLHQKSPGYMCMLEIVKLDGSAIINAPSTERLENLPPGW